MIRYKLKKTKDILTSRSGLVVLREVIQRIKLVKQLDHHLPQTGSNRGYAPSIFGLSLILMLNEGYRSLDDISHLAKDKVLRDLFGLKNVPKADSLGKWLKRVGFVGVKGLTEINRKIIEVSLEGKKEVTLDADATLALSRNKNAKWTYQNCTGYMPIMGFIAETGQAVASEFRHGNVAPAANNLEFIQQCEDNLPLGVLVKKLRIDAAGYQHEILDYCKETNKKFTIRAVMSRAIKSIIPKENDGAWEPMISRDGTEIEGESTCKVVHSMQNSKHAFTLIIQRKKVKGQRSFEISSEDQETAELEGYIYRAIATNHDNWDNWDNSKIIHWYNQRGEHAENRIKEIKSDFAADRVPCQDFAANALFLSFSTLAYNLFALIRQMLPPEMRTYRAKKVRSEVYAIAGKMVKHARSLCLALAEEHYELINQILNLMRQHLPYF
jgi:hypothetical protein